MSTYSGIDGYVFEGTGSAIVGELTSWSITITHAPVDTRVFQGSGWGAFNKGAKSWTGSASGYFDCTDTGQGSIHTAITTDLAIDMYFNISDDYYFYGSTYPTSQSVDQAVDGVANVSFEFQGIGAIAQCCA